jgi:hypothetical protein
MRSRIWKVCYGHFKWLYKNLQPENGKKTFYPHYWANGEVIEGWDDRPFLRGRSLADTPFHIIKVAELYKVAENSVIKTEIIDKIKPIIQDWIKELDERNKQDKYAFPHFREEPTHIFYFSDHVMIWRGLKSVEDLGMIEELKPSITDQGRKLSYTSTKVRTNILKRFTTKNRQSNQRMLTILRSPPETKFLLQFEDTVLFVAADLGLFDKTLTSADENKWNNKIDVWKSMINFQVDQLGSEDIDWMHPLQFALAMMMSTTNLGIDGKRGDQMSQLFSLSKSTLLGSSSGNGLFPGELDENKEPAIFSEELKSEDYWYTTFELPYILWTFQMPPKDAQKNSSSQSSIASQTASSTQFQESFMMRKNIPFDSIVDTRNIVEYTDEWMYNEPEFFDHKYTDLESVIRTILATFEKDSQLLEVFCRKYPDLKSVIPAFLAIFENDGRLLGFFCHKYPVLKPVIKAILATVEKDSQLLELLSYKYPDLEIVIQAIIATVEENSPFLKLLIQQYPNSESIVKAILATFNEDNQLLELFSHKYPAVEFVIKAFLATLDKDGYQSHDLKSSFISLPATDTKGSHIQVMQKIIGGQAQHFEGEVGGYVIDVPKSKFVHEKNKYIKKKISENCQMYEPLGKTRTPEEAKKRFIHFYRPNRGTALVCYFTSSERDNISTFFERHALYDKYFFDEITPILNTWETELHLSFYRITERPNPSEGIFEDIFEGISPSDEIEFPQNYQKSQNKRISRAVMSFRFDGDVFDRYWTCHFFEYEPQRKGSKLDFDSFGAPNSKMANKSYKGDPRKQRQVLELLLFDEILQEMLEGTQNIFTCVKNEGLGDPRNPSASAETIRLTSPLSDPLDLFQEINGDVFDSTTQLWRKLHHILQVVEDDLRKNLTNIGHWKDRQAGRQPNRPRWTLKDERSYRSAISKLLASNDQKIIKLERCCADIESFKMLLAKRLEITREDLDLRRANDLRLFTYVTVVFLPISFATGVFSMSDAPTAGLMGSMATTATLALLVTVVALFNAKILEAYLAQPLLSIFRRVFYYPLISPCIYFLALSLFFPLHESLPKSILPPGKSRDFLERLMKIGAINEARRDFFEKLRQSNDRQQKNDGKPEKDGKSEKKSAKNETGEKRSRILKWFNKKREGDEEEGTETSQERLIPKSTHPSSGETQSDDAFQEGSEANSSS